MAWDLADAAILAARNEFGSTVVYTPAAGGGPYTLTAILDRPYQSTVISPAEVELAGRGPVLDLRLADLAVEPLQGDALTVDGGSYTVEEVEPDGRGGVKLLLHGG